MRFVVIGDIVNSRSLADRGAAQDLFRREVENLNTDYPDQILSPMIVTLGDEFQGVLSSSSKLFLIVHQIQTRLRQQQEDLQIRFGFGLGEIDTEINREAAIGMDGSAFHAARDALERAKSDNRQYAIWGQDDAVKLLDFHCVWIDMAVSKWKPHRLAMMHYHRLGESQQRIETRLGISQPAISQNLSNTETQIDLKSERVIEEFLYPKPRSE